MIREPLWTTWPKYKENTDEHKFLDFVKSIKDNGFKGQIELDENWEVRFSLSEHVFHYLLLIIFNFSRHVMALTFSTKKSLVTLVK